ncbi:MAG: UDP-3-O-(3-hydroxymyristoyl)glucosamine N-acyltransferase [Alphaproteobacteria bacterium]|nr:UDP-3-O-(3-hydroxymyristoyl)glucosamine N-acyltransferase [Alphaproteobacteria bacterium]
MPDKRFFNNRGPFSVEELAKLSDSEVFPKGSELKEVQDVAPINIADVNDISFIDNKKYIEDFKKSKAGVCIAHPAMKDFAPEGMILLLNSNPYMAYANIATAFYAPESRKGVHKKAFIDKSAKLGKNCFVGAGAVIGKNVQIGDDCEIEANATIADGVVIGNNTTIGANASVTHAIIGNDCYIYTGARIGQDGFGFAMSAKGHKRIPQMGRVIIEDRVEIGANTTIDRGAGPDTLIKSGAMIDNLVQLGHNVEVGENSVIVSQVGVSGSTKIGKFCVLAGQAGIAGHLKIEDGAKIAAQSGVISNISAGEEVMGCPAIPIKQFFKQAAYLKRIIKKRKAK